MNTKPVHLLQQNFANRSLDQEHCLGQIESYSNCAHLIYLIRYERRYEERTRELIMDNTHKRVTHSMKETRRSH